MSTPLAWDEVSDAADGEPLVFTAPEVLERAERLGDLFADTVSVTQELPALTAAG